MWHVINDDTPIPNEHVLIKIANEEGHVAVIDGVGMTTSLEIPQGYRMVEWRRYPDDRVSVQSPEITKIKAITAFCRIMEERMGHMSNDAIGDTTVRTLFEGARFMASILYTFSLSQEGVKVRDRDAEALIESLPDLDVAITSMMQAIIKRKGNGHEG